MSSEEALDLQRPECSDTLRGHGAEVFGFPIVHLVIFQENQSLGLLMVWVHAGSQHEEVHPWQRS